jgi:hypothetical protein
MAVMRITVRKWFNRVEGSSKTGGQYGGRHRLTGCCGKGNILTNDGPEFKTIRKPLQLRYVAGIPEGFVEG